MQLHETLARLIGLLGADRIGTPMLEETHRPDAFRMEPFAWEFRHPKPEIGHSERSVAKSRNPVALPLSFTTGSLGPSRTGIFARDDEERERGVCDSTGVRGCVPLRRFRKRKKATVLLENNRPAHVRAAEVRAGLAVEGTTMRQDGPFPLSGNWWDERAWARVEWDVEIENGVIARCHCDQDGWAIDGIYD